MCCFLGVFFYGWLVGVVRSCLVALRFRCCCGEMCLDDCCMEIVLWFGRLG